MTLHLNVIERPSDGDRRGLALKRQPSHSAARERIRVRPFLAQTLDYPATPITSHLDTLPTVVGASSIILFKLFMLGLLLYAL